MRRIVLVAAFVLIGVQGGRLSGAGWIDPCLHFISEIQALNAKIAATEQQLHNLPDDERFDTKRAQLEGVLAIYRQNLGILQNDYQRCEANNPPPSPPPSVDPFSPLTNVPDPQLAIGRDYLVTADSGNVAFYPRLADGSIDAGHVWATSSDDLFRQLTTTLNQNVGATDSPLTCRFRDGEYSGWGCIRETYDTRVFYDAKRDRFWIAAGLRPKAWRCDPDNLEHPDPDNQTGYFTGADPQPINGVEKACHRGHADEVHRYIAVAVTEVGEHPWDFFRWVLVDEYADWPQMTVANDWLIVNQRGDEAGEARAIHVFDAEALAAGTSDGTVLQVPGYDFPLDVFNVDAYDWTHDEHVNVSLDTALYLTTMHGASDGVAYFAAGDGNYLIVYGIRAPANNPKGKPIMLKPAAVDVGSAGRVFDANNPPVWRHNTLYYSFETCADDECNRRFLRLLKVPVHHAYSGNHGVWATSDVQKGYRAPSLGRTPGDIFSYSRPVIDVNLQDDVVMAFSRTGGITDATAYPGVRYSVLYHGRNRFSQSQLVAVGEFQPVDGNGNYIQPWGGGVIDLGGAGVDPRGGLQVWLSHAYANLHDLKYRAVVTAVVP